MSPSTVAHTIFIMTTTLTALMVIEYAWFLSDEVRLIWPKFRKNTEAKVFLVTRYVGLAGQSFNIWFSYRMASEIPNHPIACKAWYSYQTATIQCMLVSVELLLMQLVDKMYRKDKYIRGLLLVFGGAQCAAMAISARLIVTGVRYSPTCVIIGSHSSNGRIFAGISIITTYMFILVMMQWRYFKGSSGWSEASRAWLKLTVRDGSCTTIAVAVILIFMMLHNFGVFETQMTGNIVFYVLLSCLWFAGGRIVLHQEKLRQSHESQKGGANDACLWTMTVEVEPDYFGPFDDPDACPASHSDLKVESSEVSTSFDSGSDVGTKDITDESLCEWEEDNASLSDCSPTLTLTETGISGEGSG
ncbi:hypothetical protein DFH29DRAFT_910829 [Suillus ampliporus]|nr:hypothetical protein DFH29DRAFT_910829 [Suillus ampliporus]